MGFTYDTNTQNEYFDIIKKLLETDLAEKNKQKYSELAKKFFYLYYFRYYCSLEFMDYIFGKGINLLVSDISQLEPGKNKILDYICDSILNSLPIISEDRVPPAGAEL